MSGGINESALSRESRDVARWEIETGESLTDADRLVQTLHTHDDYASRVRPTDEEQDQSHTFMEEQAAPARAGVTVDSDNDTPELMMRSGGLFRVHAIHAAHTAHARKLEDFREGGVSCCVTMYRESFEEVQSTLRTFGNQGASPLSKSPLQLDIALNCPIERHCKKNPFAMAKIAIAIFFSRWESLK